MTDGESARLRRNKSPSLSRAELMTDGAIRCRLLFTRLLWLWFALPDYTLRVQRPTAPV